MGGEATLWEASLAMGATDEALRQKFISQVDQVTWRCSKCTKAERLT